MTIPFESGDAKITSIVGYRTHPITGLKNSPHYGLDIVGLGSKNIIAVAPGTVVRSRMVTDKSDATWQWGNYVAVEGDDGYTVYYCHMSKRIARVGQRVKAGQVIGIEGSTGQATGSHLHIELRHGAEKCNLDAGGTKNNIADYLGIPNKVGIVKAVDYRSEVVKRLQLADETAKYLDGYRFASDLWFRLYQNMK